MNGFKEESKCGVIIFLPGEHVEVTWKSTLFLFSFFRMGIIYSFQRVSKFNTLLFLCKEFYFKPCTSKSFCFNYIISWNNNFFFKGYIEIQRTRKYLILFKKIKFNFLYHQNIAFLKLFTFYPIHFLILWKVSETPGIFLNFFNKYKTGKYYY